MSQIEAGAIATNAQSVAQWDGLIKRTAYATWRRLRPASCSWEDIAQEVRLALLQKALPLERARHRATFISACVRHEAFQARKKLAGDELKLGNALVYVDDTPWVEEFFYSSRGDSSDEFLD